MSEPPSFPDAPESLAESLGRTAHLGHALIPEMHAHAAGADAPTALDAAPSVAEAGTQAGCAVSVGTQTEHCVAGAAVQAAPARESAGIQASTNCVSTATQTTLRVSGGAQTAPSKSFADATVSTQSDTGPCACSGTEAEAADLAARGQRTLAESASQTDTHLLPAGVQCAPQHKSTATQAQPLLVSSSVQHDASLTAVGIQTERNEAFAGIQATPAVASSGIQTERHEAFASVQATPAVASAGIQTERHEACAVVQATPAVASTGIQAQPRAHSVSVQASVPAASVATQTDHHSIDVPPETFLHAFLSELINNTFMTSIFSVVIGMWAGIWLYHMSYSPMPSIYHALTRDDSTAWFDAYLS